MAQTNMLGIGDYVVIGIVLVTSCGIGIYYRFTGDRQKTLKEYLLANSEMGVISVSISIMTSIMSGVAILGNSSETYTFGFQAVVMNIGYVISAPIVMYIYLPILYRMEATSTYEYLERRFGKITRLLGSTVYLLQIILYSGVVLYIPSLALEALTGISQLMAILSVGLVSTFYSTIGGIKAVIITDIFQSFLMYFAVFSVIICAAIQAGNFSEIWKIANEGGRTELLIFDPDPTIRHSWLSLILGSSVVFVSLYVVNQSQVQRYRTVKTLKSAQITVFLSWLNLSFFNICTLFSGLAIYSKYYDCDPISNSTITIQEQLMPYYVSDAMGHLSGMTGLAIAGIISATLSTISASMNSLSAVTLEDYVKPGYRKFTGQDIPDAVQPFITKMFCFLYGILSIGVAFLAKSLGSVFQGVTQILTVVGGPMLGTFSLGMFTKTGNQKGAVSGILIGLALGLWLMFGNPKPPLPKLPVRVDGCNKTDLAPLLTQRESDNSEYFWLYRISYLYYGVIGFVSSFVFGLVISFITQKISGKGSAHSDPNLFISIIGKSIKIPHKVESMKESVNEEETRERISPSSNKE